MSPQTQVLWVRKEEKSARVGVRCLVPQDVETFQCSVSVTARVAETSLSGGVLTVSHTISILAQQTIDLTILPKTVPITFHAGKSTGSARLLLRGRLLAGSNTVVKSVSCEGYEVTWNITEQANNTAILQLAFAHKPEQGDSAGRLLIELAGKKPIRLPVVKVNVK